MDHASWCDTRYHVDYQDGGDAGPCRSKMVAVGSVFLYLRGSALGPPQVAFPEGALIPLQDCADWLWCALDLLVQAGAVLPGRTGLISGQSRG